jgi:hypothetical protein
MAWIAQEHPEHLAWHLDHVAEIEAAKRRHTAGQPPLPPTEPRDLLHLAAIQAWQALASGQPAPDLDRTALDQTIYDVFATSDGRNHVDLLCDDWLKTARQCGIPVDDEHGELRPDVLDTISHTVSAAIWFGLTNGYLTLTGRYHIPRKFLAA